MNNNVLARLKEEQEEERRSFRMAFVILNYNSFGDTRKCVDSIRSLKGGDEAFIVVVDNASPDGSGKSLRRLYKGFEKVKVLSLKENLGFSRGNNVGYRYIRKYIDTDFITICNSDIIFDADDYIEKTEEIYDSEGFAVLGPDIYNPELKVHQSPLGKESPSEKDVKRTILLNAAAEMSFPVFWRLAGDKLRNMVETRESVQEFDIPADDVPLMGACLTFSADFMNVSEKAFTPATFLYYEEFILFNRCRRENLRMVYRPELHVLHKEGVSTRAAATDEKDRYKRLVSNTRKAALIYRSDMVGKR